MPGQDLLHPSEYLDDEDVLDSQDIEQLQLVGNEHRRVIIALGGASFPDSIKQSISNNLDGAEWLCVQMDSITVLHIEHIPSVVR